MGGTEWDGNRTGGRRQPTTHTGGYKDESYGWAAHDVAHDGLDRLSLTLISFVRKGGKRGWALLIFSIVFLRLCATKGGEPVT